MCTTSVCQCQAKINSSTQKHSVIQFLTPISITSASFHPYAFLRIVRTLQICTPADHRQIFIITRARSLSLSHFTVFMFPQLRYHHQLQYQIAISQIYCVMALTCALPSSQRFDLRANESYIIPGTVILFLKHKKCR